MTAPLLPTDFESLPERLIAVALGADEVALEIAEIRLLPPTPVRAQPFSLTLRHKGARSYATQGNYTFHHPVLGDLHLFMSPLGPDDEGMCYEVIFN